jgi:electron transfer flavoprotein alpha subunit
MDNKVAEHSGVMVFAEVTEGRLSKVAGELLGCGRELADALEEGLAAVIVGNNITDLAQDIIASGADTVYVVDDPLLEDYQADAYIPVMEKVIKQVAPRVLLLGQTSVGRDLAPRLAFRLGTVATLDCIKLAISADTRRLQQTRPVYGGNAMAIFESEFEPQIATVRAKAYPAPEPDASRQGQVVAIDAKLEPSLIRTRVLEKVSQKESGIRLEDAAVVVAGGRGIGSAEAFSQLAELAQLLKGAVGASRPPCDNGWVVESAQVGITGKIVAPDLYFAIALSGSSQHISGCSGARNIIAINKDPEANIFSIASYGIVGDWKKVLPAFTGKLRELLAG